MEPSFNILGLVIPKTIELKACLYNPTTAFGTVDQTLLIIDGCIIGEMGAQNNRYDRWIKNSNDYQWIVLPYSSMFGATEKKSDYDSFSEVLIRFCKQISNYYLVCEDDCDQDPVHIITNKEKNIKEILTYIGSYKRSNNPKIRAFIYEHQ